MKGQASLTVSSVLSLEALRGAEVLAGARGLSRRVGGVNVIEVPDVARWLNGGELLLTSAYLWRRNSAGLSDLVERLDELGVAALAHKPSPEVPRLSDQVLAVAEQRGFPVVQLPLDLAYRTVFEAIYLLLFGSRHSWSRPDLSSWLGLAADDHSMADAVRRLSEKLGVRCEVTDELEGLVHVGSPDDGVSSRPVEAAPERPDAPGLPEPHQVVDDGGVSWVVPLVVAGEVAGELKIDGDDDLTLPTLLEVADLLSLLQVRNRAFRQGLHGASDLTFRALLRGGLSPTELSESGRVLGLADGVSWSLVVVSVADPVVSSEQLAAVRRDLERRLPSTVTVVASDRDVELVLFVRADGAAPATVVSTVQEVVGRRRGAEARVVAGGSATTSRLGDLPLALRQARIALDVASAREATALIAFDELGVEAVLAQVALDPVAQEFIARRIGRVEDPELLRTLELYVACHGNKSATANAIPMHRSGLLYRLRKLSSVLDADLDDPEVMNEVWLALKLRRVLSIGA